MAAAAGREVVEGVVLSATIRALFFQTLLTFSGQLKQRPT